MKANGLIIRDAVQTDAVAVAAIYAEHVHAGTASFDTVPRSAQDTAAKIAECAERGWPFIVGECAGVVVGYAYATQFRDRAAYTYSCENSIYINAELRGQGIGKALLNHLLSAAEQSGFRQMIAVIGGGEPPSVGLHSSLGFQHAGRMQSVGRKFGEWLDTVYMQRALGKGDRTPPPVEPK